MSHKRETMSADYIRGWRAGLHRAALRLRETDQDDGEAVILPLVTTTPEYDVAVLSGPQWLDLCSVLDQIQEGLGDLAHEGHLTVALQKAAGVLYARANGDEVVP